ncbi:hypothetical protein SDC9_211363 [bioreactor metagenome]|uniref:Uncharacterized protein n=1 Tax=bioreactor metagenome TaxID=1076179 RepID=A0A645JLK0_9ZZZZ
MHGFDPGSVVEQLAHKLIACRAGPEIHLPRVGPGMADQALQVGVGRLGHDGQHGRRAHHHGQRRKVR